MIFKILSFIFISMLLYSCGNTNKVADLGDEYFDLLTNTTYGLGIPEVGVTVAKNLASEFGNLPALQEASIERLKCPSESFKGVNKMPQK